MSTSSNTAKDLYSCPRCRDTGWVEQEDRSVRPCACQLRKRERQRLERSGLADVVREKTFDAFRAVEPYQLAMKNIVQAWTEEVLIPGERKRPWLFVGGAPGSGKTHLCTAACGRLLDAGVTVRYMLWTEEARQLKGYANDPEAFDDLAYPLKTVSVLYIDDLFKVAGKHRDAVKDTDIRVAFELINARYNRGKPTIISTEWLMDELLNFDEATFSRVKQLSSGYMAQIAPGENRNYRLQEPTP